MPGENEFTEFSCRKHSTRCAPHWQDQSQLHSTANSMSTNSWSISATVGPPPHLWAMQGTNWPNLINILMWKCRFQWYLRPPQLALHLHQLCHWPMSWPLCWVWLQQCLQWILICPWMPNIRWLQLTNITCWILRCLQPSLLCSHNDQMCKHHHQLLPGLAQALWLIRWWPHSMRSPTTSCRHFDIEEDDEEDQGEKVIQMMDRVGGLAKTFGQKEIASDIEVNELEEDCKLQVKEKGKGRERGQGADVGGMESDWDKYMRSPKVVVKHLSGWHSNPSAAVSNYRILGHPTGD